MKLKWIKWYEAETYNEEIGYSINAWYLPKGEKEKMRQWILIPAVELREGLMRSFDEFLYVEEKESSPVNKEEVENFFKEVKALFEETLYLRRKENPVLTNLPAFIKSRDRKVSYVDREDTEIV